VGYRFSLVLSREISDDESSLLQEANRSAPVFGTDSLPTNAEVSVTKMDFDDTVSPTLAEAIEFALEAVKKVPELTVPGLTVPAQPAGPATDDQKVVAGEVIEDDEVAEVQPAAEQPAAEETSTKEPSAKKPSTRKPSTRKPATKKPATKKAAEANGHATENGAGSVDDASDLVEVTASAD
jgi:hypothetical protein